MANQRKFGNRNQATIKKHTTRFGTVARLTCVDGGTEERRDGGTEGRRDGESESRRRLGWIGAAVERFDTRVVTLIPHPSEAMDLIANLWALTSDHPSLRLSE